MQLKKRSVAKTIRSTARVEGALSISTVRHRRENREIAEQLREAGGLLESQGANPFRARAEGQHTIVTEARGPLAGKRVVRGREAECRALYAQEQARQSA